MDVDFSQMLAIEKSTNWMLNVDFLICKTATLISSPCSLSDTPSAYQQIENLTFNTPKTFVIINPPIPF